MTKTDTELEAIPVNAEELGEILGCSPRQVYVLERQGLVVKIGRAFDRDRSIQRMIPHLGRLAGFRGVLPNASDEKLRELEQVCLDEERGLLAGKLADLDIAARRRTGAA
jgi:phage terminase Nu1 subunit (DNA packaging protein)